MLDLNPTYYERMASSLGDKAKMIQYVQSDAKNIVDVGGADGILAEYIKDHFIEASVTVVEPIHEAAENARKRGIKAVECWAEELDQNFTDLDTVIASSLIHEVFSYGDASGKIANVDRFFDSAFNSLRSGGRFIIRDGVNPGYEFDEILFSKEHEKECVEGFLKFMQYSPFAQEDPNKDRSIYARLKAISGQNDSVNYSVTGLRSSLMEFAYTFTWGDKSFNREVQEFYGVFTLNELSELASSHGFDCIHKESYLQEGYPLNLQDKMTFKNGWPDSNAVWVFVKP